MADEQNTATAESESSAEPDFASVALGLVTGTTPETKTDTPPAAKVPEKESTKPERPADIPETLLGKKDAKKEPEPEKEPESEIAKIKPPDFRNPVKKEQWEALHNKAAELEKGKLASDRKVAEMEKRIAEAETKGKNTEELEKKLADLQKQNDEYQELVRQTNVEMDPQFRKTYIEGRANKVKEIEAIISDAGGEVGDVATALALKGKARVDALRLISDELPGYLQGLLGTAT